MTTSTDSDCGLAGLPLTPPQLAALSGAGVVSSEPHGRGLRYRLRFRLDRRQVAISLGSDPRRAEAVRRALAVLQAPCRAQRELQINLAAARQARRRAKKQLYTIVQQLGLHWHGRLIRRPRAVTAQAPAAD